MNIELTNKEFRRLLDMVYIGNWVLNSTRAEDRFKDYDDLQEKIFGCCAKLGLKDLYTTWYGHVFPSRAFEEGGIHEAIADYEDAVFYDILAEELARRDMSLEHTDPDDVNELNTRIDEYFDEFEANGIDNLMIEK
ncbi:MAG TPA: hypothetical protein IAC18_04460 [Candidatus Scatomorpha merdipullorum]|uniref:Uncharacterized protein n=1 Tax=Candidatus Scatomorpha merdipullorum TaxID=2840927 RepID=A0A9D1FCX6_9FIRM|nr:hypothetical protein [Candidatus Scatomorpha merdipullorum]